MSKIVTLQEYAKTHGIRLATINNRRIYDKDGFPKPKKHYGNVNVWSSLALDRYFEEKPIRVPKLSEAQVPAASDLLASQQAAAEIAEQLSSKCSPGVAATPDLTNEFNDIHDRFDKLALEIAELKQMLMAHNHHTNEVDSRVWDVINHLTETSEACVNTSRVNGGSHVQAN